LILVGWIPILDVQAKDRLTGAVILVVLLVLVVPELLSGPDPKVAATTVQRSDEPPLRSYTMDLGDTRRAPASDPATAAASPAAVQAPASAAPAASAPAAVAPAPPAKVPVPVVTAPPVAAPAPVTVPRPAAAAPVQEPAKAPRTAVAHAAPPASSGGGWTVQLGSFASRANAERLVADLKTKGFAAFSTESGSGGRTLYRVRVGPAGDRASAEALGAKLRAAGHAGTLTQHP
jgi:cell division septation protein DedD